MRLPLCVLVHLGVLVINLVDISQVHSKDQLDVVIVQLVVPEFLPVNLLISVVLYQLVVIKD